MKKPDYVCGPETPDFSPGSGFIKIEINGGNETCLILRSRTLKSLRR